MPTNLIKAVIFDMDGVLIDAKEWHYESLNRALALFGYEISRADHLAIYDGLPTRRKLEILTKERGLPASLHPFISRMKQRYTMELVDSSCHPRVQHVYALSQLKKEQYLIGLASNSIRATVARMMERAGLDSYFDFMFSNEDVKLPKPAPDIYLAAAARARVTPRECVVVEDNHNGVEAATKAGTHVLHVESVDDVTYARIREFIQSVESASDSHREHRLREQQPATRVA